MKKVAVFASGTGSNFDVLCAQAANGRLNCEIAALICDRPGASVAALAERWNVPAFVFSVKQYLSKSHYEKEVLKKLVENQVDWIVLAGYMRIVGPLLLERYEGRMINIHPSLLPAFPGKDAIGQALRAGVKVTGVTVHYVDEGIDSGKIIAQRAVPVLENDNEETLKKRIQKVEHQLYPQTIARLLAE